MRPTFRGLTRRGLPALALAALAGLSAPAAAQTSMRFTLDWRFEGPAALFTNALDKGYFKAEGLDVTIDPAAGSRERVVGYGAWVFEEPGGERRPAGMPDDQARG